MFPQISTLGLTLVTALFSGCSSVMGGNPWGTWVLYQSELCLAPGIETGVTWISDTTALASFYAKPGQSRLAPPQHPMLDFSRQVAVVIRMGAKPTTGYRITLLDTEWKDETLWVRVEQESPLPGAWVQKRTTAPCLVLGLPRVPLIAVEDNTGQKLGFITP
ncbi:putative Protease complex subunit PrcB family protein [Gammaproteobacteria bacterium]